MDTAVNLKHNNCSNGDRASVPERLQKRNQARLEEVERRKEAQQSQSVVEEKAEYFLCVFNGEQAYVEELLSGGKLQEAAEKLAMLQKFLNDSLAFLSQYEVAHAQTALSKLQASLAGARQEVLPKKKFAFRARSKVGSPALSPATEPADSQVGAEQRDASLEQCGFSHLEGKLLSLTGEDIRGKDVNLSHLSRCKVRLFGSPSTLHLKHIDSCEILCGPVSTSVFVDQCRNSTLVFPCHQLRTHNTSHTQVYLHVTSRAIIEDCHAMSFAPFSWSYPGLDQDFSASTLDRNRNNWDQVDDFNWLSAGSPSPNWSLVPEEERKTSWDP